MLRRIKLPKSRNKIGYNPAELKRILKMLKISESLFERVAGINTCGVNAKGEPLMYKYDLNRFLEAILRGQSIVWD